MNSLLIGLIGALAATNQAAAVSNLVEQTTGISVKIPDPNDPVEKEFQKIEDDDDAAMAEVDGWIRQNNEFAAKGAGISKVELNDRIHKRLDKVRSAYLDFINRHPKHAGVRLAYASFLDATGDDEAEIVQLEMARDIDPKNPAAWNQLANYCGEFGPVTNAFADYQKAIDIDPTEPVYYHNFGTTVYLFRKDAREFYNINEQQVFDKAITLYSNSMRLDPTNFALASDVAETYYGIRPMRTNDALLSWTNALALAGNEAEREGVYLHLARIKMSVGRYEEAHAHLNSVTNSFYDELKRRLLRSLHDREFGTNSIPSTADTNTASAQLILPAASTTAPVKKDPPE